MSAALSGVALEALLDVLCKTGRSLMRERRMRLDSCIASCRVGMDVLRRFRVHSTPLAVKFTAFNAKAHEFMLAKRLDWVREMRDGAYAIGSASLRNQGPDPDKWDGHLVLIVGATHLVDLSADQMDRPARDLQVGAFYAPLPKKALRARGDKVALDNPHGGTLWYEADPENQAWKASPDWRENRERFAPLVDEVHRAVREALGARR